MYIKIKDGYAGKELFFAIGEYMYNVKCGSLLPRLKFGWPLTYMVESVIRHIGGWSYFRWEPKSYIAVGPVTCFVTHMTADGD